ncbi:hypothetical protein HCN44_010282 [Aphidius gifuensis]|uniref:SET domain-containing protein n=1 Tax=Aphidius gifuensis TaxID=684658 RepID=A0A834XW41_APHGI|nr:SET and MYND domain-containing protein 4-like [Aphidius gifuensis]KAF7993687.1 hypothetical protein HCN44_010282 [Aphidius gifuensis]
MNSENENNWTELFNDIVYKTVVEYQSSSDYNEENSIKFILNNLTNHEKFKIIRFDTFNITKKSTKESIKFRLKGNSYFISSSTQESNLDKAVEEYTKSVAHAPSTSEELAIGYANRSAVFFKARLISDCLLDIEHALENNYPDSLKAKLYYRKAMCLRVLNSNDNPEIKEAFTEAKKWSIEMSEENKKLMEIMLKEQLEMTDSINKTIFTKWNSDSFLPKLDTENSIIPGLSDALKMEYNEKFGRHMIATRDIRPGEILGIQKPYASAVIEKIRYTICWNCENQTWSSIPCTHCVDVIYCSTICRDTGNLKHHDIECHILSEMFHLKMDTSMFLSLRLTIMALKQSSDSLEILKNNLKKIDQTNDSKTKGFTNNILDPTSYRSAYGLSHNTVDKNLQLETKTWSIIVAYLLATKTKIFGKKFNKNEITNFKENKYFIFLINLIEINRIISDQNCFSIYASEKIEKTWTIAPTFTFFNHSCIRMVVRRFIGNMMTLTALYPIKKNEQVFETYTVQYDKVCKFERQKYLMKWYQFNCQCQACTNDWCIPRENSIRHLNNSIDMENIKIKKIFWENKLINFGRKFHDFTDLSSDIKKIIDIIEENLRIYSNNSIKVVDVVQLLEDLLKIMQDKYLSLDI